MNIKRKAHVEASKELLEVLSLAAFLALTVDTLWCLRDMVTNGVTVGMVLIAMGLATATTITGIAAYKYHMGHVKQHMKVLLAEQLKICKRRTKRMK